jgi:hypothetical protein
MKYLWPIFLLSILQLPVDGAEKPNVDWYVHTVISDGIPNRHNLVRRAIVTYSESDPRLEVEIIDWRSGMGGQILLLRKSIDIEGGQKICPNPAESWCGKVGSIFWKDGKLVHSIMAKGKNYECVTTIMDDLTVTTRCSADKP